MLFSVVTPSFRNSAWLRLCIASVADQEGIEHEHLVQDACSEDGTQDWLPHEPRVRAFIEKDAGMYDAINRGFRRAQGDYLAYLNCDEQYLPGALQAVANYFAMHPDVDVVIAGTVIVDAAGRYLASRHALKPLPASLWLRFNVMTCSMFLRRRVIDEMGLFFDPQWRALGDFFWLAEAVRRGVRFGELRRFTATFTETGENLGLDDIAGRERAEKVHRTPRWVRLAAPALIAQHRWRMFRQGAFSQQPFSYSLYTTDSPSRRITIEVAKPTGLWRRPNSTADGQIPKLP